MKPAPFTYHAPADLDQTLALLAEHGPEAKVLAGGQSLVPVLNMRLANPAHLIDINHVPGLDTVVANDDAVHVGALVRHAHLLSHSAARTAQPLLRQALQWVAHPVIRNRGTTLGSIVHADPSGEMPAVLALTDGRVRLRSAGGEREVPAAEFFVGPMESAIADDELAVEAIFGRFPAGTRTGFTETARRHGDYALAGVALAVSVQDGPGGGTVGQAQASFVSVTDVPDVLDLTPVVGGAAVADLAGLADAVAEAVATHVDPVGDIHASADYRRHLAVVQTQRLLSTLVGATAEEEIA
ncbi:FAD binding domain-containing protein [Ornithinimicrobium pratense]|uniref:Xanthine dehydrogenase family protein subunit M n=1 Tax=Ornithinimicrobium pratense TaxID=2593973 RepID=A0A5J6V289_9MICO|nr:FAD binding domain-containing protein [Ornithinimicrobium pratense]QFG67787.1 xanthine dehydrogenase family protein subunit M [Ornithinimicrobium pratense]